jgi:hypothetical protein
MNSDRILSTLNHRSSAQINGSGVARLARSSNIAFRQHHSARE